MCFLFLSFPVIPNELGNLLYHCLLEAVNGPFKSSQSILKSPLHFDGHMMMVELLKILQRS